jgi:hypothetical protein
MISMTFFGQALCALVRYPGRVGASDDFLEAFY